MEGMRMVMRALLRDLMASDIIGGNTLGLADHGEGKHLSE